jgi:hypothetical protein
MIKFLILRKNRNLVSSPRSPGFSSRPLGMYLLKYIEMYAVQSTKQSVRGRSGLWSDDSSKYGCGSAREFHPTSSLKNKNRFLNPYHLSIFLLVTHTHSLHSCLGFGKGCLLATLREPMQKTLLIQRI